MLKLASLSLVALLSFASPAIAKECVKPSQFPTAIRVNGADLTKFREIAPELPVQTDLVLLLKGAPVALVFVKGCMIGYGVIGPKPVEPKKAPAQSL